MRSYYPTGSLWFGRVIDEQKLQKHRGNSPLSETNSPAPADDIVCNLQLRNRHYSRIGTFSRRAVRMVTAKTVLEEEPEAKRLVERSSTTKDLAFSAERKNVDRFADIVVKRYARHSFISRPPRGGSNWAR